MWVGGGGGRDPHPVPFRVGGRSPNLGGAVGAALHPYELATLEPTGNRPGMQPEAGQFVRKEHSRRPTRSHNSSLGCPRPPRPRPDQTRG